MVSRLHRTSEGPGKKKKKGRETEGLRVFIRERVCVTERGRSGP